MVKISSLLKRGIYEIRFGYNTKLGEYTTLMSDVQELSEIARHPFEKYRIRRRR